MWICLSNGLRSWWTIKKCDLFVQRIEELMHNGLADDVDTCFLGYDKLVEGHVAISNITWFDFKFTCFWLLAFCMLFPGSLPDFGVKRCAFLERDDASSSHVVCIGPQSWVFSIAMHFLDWDVTEKGLTKGHVFKPEKPENPKTTNPKTRKTEGDLKTEG